jgi:hypothetical protein
MLMETIYIIYIHRMGVDVRLYSALEYTVFARVWAAPRFLGQEFENNKKLVYKQH